MGQKEKKPAKIAKIAKSFLAFFWRKYWSQRAEILYGLSLYYCLQMLFYKDISILKKIENQSSPPKKKKKKNNNNNIDCSMVWASPLTKRPQNSNLT